MRNYISCRTVDYFRFFLPERIVDNEVSITK